LTTRSSSLIAPLPAAEELGLADLLDLFTPDEPAAVVPPAGRSLRSSGTRLRAEARGWVRRAAGWGAPPAVPGVPDDRRLPFARPASTEVQ
jgi:hypothetical protein